jgi:O-antigen ligase
MCISFVLLYFILGNNILDWYRVQGVFERGSKAGALSGRLFSYEKQIRIFWDDPVFGSGFASPINTIDVSDDRAMKSSAYLGSFVETGILGGILFFAWICTSIFEVFRNAVKRRNSWIAQYGFMFVALLAVNSTVESLLLMAGNVLILNYYFILGFVSDPN